MFIIGCSASKEFVISNIGRLDVYTEAYQKGYETDFVLALKLNKGIISDAKILIGSEEELFDNLLIRLALANQLDLSKVTNINKYDSISVRVQFCILPQGKKLRTKNKIEIKQLEPSLGANDIVLSEADILKSKTKNYPNLNISSVDITFTKAGQKKFELLTSQNLNQKVALILDGYVLVEPKIIDPIKSGRIEITGLKPYAAKYVSGRINKLCEKKQ
jgi:hypothetical protein